MNKKVEISLQINTSPDLVIKAFTDPKMLNEWWGVQRSHIIPEKGGIYCLAWNISDTGFGFISYGTINRYHPKKQFIIDPYVYMNPEKQILGPMSLTVKAEKSGHNSTVYLCQDGYKSGEDWDWYYNAVESAWPIVANSLKNYLELNVYQ